MAHGRHIAALNLLILSAFAPYSSNAASFYDDQKGDATLFIRYPMIHAHNAGTGDGLNDDYKGWDAFSANQGPGISEQLACGARAFDIRPFVDASGDLRTAHGPIVGPDLLSDMLSQAVTFANANKDEILVLNVRFNGLSSHHTVEGGATETWERTKEAFASANISLGDPGCSDFSFETLTLGEAKTLGRLPGGGSIFVIQPYACYSVVDNHDSSVVCSKVGTVPESVPPNAFERAGTVGLEYCCRLPECSATASVPVKNMFEYLESTTKQPSDSHLWEAQALWQMSSAALYASGMNDVNASIWIDNVESGINTLVLHAVAEGRFEHLNLLSLDFVCHQGPQILTALRYGEIHQVPTVAPSKAPSIAPTTKPSNAPSISTSKPTVFERIIISMATQNGLSLGSFAIMLLAAISIS